LLTIILRCFWVCTSHSSRKLHDAIVAFLVWTLRSDSHHTCRLIFLSDKNTSLISVFICTDDLASEDEESDNEDEPGWTPEDEEEFRTEMDKDGDGKLNRDEIYRWLVPEDYDHIVDESNHLFSEADDDKVCPFSVAELEFHCFDFSFTSWNLSALGFQVAFSRPEVQSSRCRPRLRDTKNQTKSQDQDA